MELVKLRQKKLKSIGILQLGELQRLFLNIQKLIVKFIKSYLKKKDYIRLMIIILLQMRLHG